MTKTEASALLSKYDAAVIEELFRNGPKAETIVPEYRHGWILDAERGASWSREEITGEAYDATQGGWAYL